MASDLVARPNPDVGDEAVQPLTITVRPEGGDVVLAVAGEVDLSTVGTFRDCLDQATSGPWSSVIVDLEAVTFFDSTGLATLAAANRTLRDSGRGLGLRRPTAAVSRVLEVTGMGDLILV